VEAHKRIGLAGGRMAVTGAQPNVQKVFELTNLADLLCNDQSAT